MQPNIDTYIKQDLPNQEILNKLLKRDDSLIVFDIGSCEGEDSIKYSRFFSNAKIYACEPLPSNVEKIKNNLIKYKIDNVEIINIALSDRTDQALFYVSSGHPDNLSNSQEWDYGNKSSSLLFPDLHTTHHPWLKFNENIVVNTDTLKNICDSKNIKNIDYIHIDVQGAELQVLSGAEDLLKNTKIIWMEVENIQLYKDQPLKKDVEDFMKKHGFYKLRDTVSSISGDQLYINRRFYKNILNIKLELFIQKIFGV
jgi:FkbM family methyltransferase